MTNNWVCLEYYGRHHRNNTEIFIVGFTIVGIFREKKNDNEIKRKNWILELMITFSKWNCNRRFVVYESDWIGMWKIVMKQKWLSTDKASRKIKVKCCIAYIVHRLRTKDSTKSKRISIDLITISLLCILLILKGPAKSFTSLVQTSAFCFIVVLVNRWWLAVSWSFEILTTFFSQFWSETSEGYTIL